MSEKPEIPHVIHYCWFGGNPLGDDEQRCIRSWQEFLPNYEIKRWDESNFEFDAAPMFQRHTILRNGRL